MYLDRVISVWKTVDGTGSSIDKKLMILSDFDCVLVYVDCEAVSTRHGSMATFHVVNDDLKIWTIHHVI